MNKSTLIALGVLIVLVAAGVIWKFSGGNMGPVKRFSGLVGGEKMELLEDEDFRKLLKRKFRVEIDYAKAGSIEMVQNVVPEGTDYLWPSSQVALELFKISHPEIKIKDQIILNSPIVLYSWDTVTDALEKQGIVTKTQNVYYIVDFPRLVALVERGATWAEIGLPDLYGKVSIISTDPSKSNSGNMFAGLLANILTGDVATEESVQKVLPRVRQFFERLGYMEHSSSDLFEQYLRTGVGAKPIIVGYESQIVEFSIKHKDLWPKIRNKVRILYPVPTVWSSHPLMTINPEAASLIQALTDEEVQKLAWTRHGFRTGMIGVQNDTRVLEVVGIPETISKVVPMPPARVMDRIINEIKTIR
jgi:hypothetical protein